MPSFHVMFHVIFFFSTNEEVRENTDCESLRISQENFYDRVSFSKVTNLQCSDCNFAIKRTHHRLFLEYVPKTIYFKKNKKRNCLLFEKKVYDGPAS